MDSNHETLNAKEQPFSTYDRDTSAGQSASPYGGGWWFGEGSVSCQTCTGSYFKWNSFELSESRMMMMMIDDDGSDEDE